MVYVVDEKGKIHRASYSTCFKCMKIGYLVPETKTIYCEICKKPVAVFWVNTEEPIEQIYPRPRKTRKKK